MKGPMQYNWPGNVRHLENTIEHAIVMGLTDEILPKTCATRSWKSSRRDSGQRAIIYTREPDKKAAYPNSA